MQYDKKKFNNENGLPVSFWSTDDNITCKDGKPLRENLSSLYNNGVKDKTYSELGTTNKTVIGSINEINTKCSAVKAPLGYINVLDYGVVNDGITDNTDAMNTLFNNGYKNLYFPKGVYAFSISITRSGISILGESMKETVFIPVEDSFQDESFSIQLNSRDGNIDNNHFSNFTIRNTLDIPPSQANGISFVGNNENDRHVFKNIIIEGFVYGLHLNGRCIWSIFENFWITGCSIGVILNGTGAKNLLTFNNIYVRSSKMSGLLIATEGEENTPKALAFNNCNFEHNCRDTAEETQYAVKLADFDEVSFSNCYIENNSNGTSTTYAIYCDGTYNRCLNIINSLIWGQEYGICVLGTIMSGTIQGNRIINDIDDITIGTSSNSGGGHAESSFTLGGNTLSHPVTKVADGNNNTSATTLNPLSLAYRHANNNATPDVRNCNVIMSWTNEAITNFLNGTEGQIVIVYVYGSASKTFTNGDYIQLRGSSSVTVRANETITFLKFNNKWIEIARNVS